MLSKNQITEIQRLHLKKQRELQQMFIVEGIKSVLELIDTVPGKVEKVYAVPAFISNNQNKLKAVRSKIVEVTYDELKKISLQSSPNEVLASCRQLGYDGATFDPEKSFSLYLDDVRDPGNMGTIIRLADWFGIKHVFCSQESCEFYNPKVIQASMGAFLRVQVKYITLEDLIAEFRIARIYGAVLDGKNIYNEKLRNGLVIIGNEANGINEENLRFINCPLTIPAASISGSESLNAAMATAIICSEFFRQTSIHA